MNKQVETNKGVIYIIANTALPKQSKIGYADDAEKAVKQLNTKGMFKGNYTLYATYETDAVSDDKQVGKLLATINDNIGIVEIPDGKAGTAEYYVIKPEEAYRLLLTIARISGTQDNLKKYNGRTITSTVANAAEKVNKAAESKPATVKVEQKKIERANGTQEKKVAKVETEKRTRKPNLKFSDYKIPVGSMLEYVKDKTKKVKVVNDREVEYDGAAMSVSECAKRLLNSKGGVQGTNYFSYKGKTLCTIRDELGI